MRIEGKITALPLVVCALLVAIAIFASQSPAMTSQATSPPRHRTVQKVPPQVFRVTTLDDLRPRSEDDRRRAARFDRPGPPLVEAGNVRGFGGRHGVPGNAMPSLVDFVMDLTCSADVIVIGTGKRSRVMFNTSETALFTDYAVEGERWIRPHVAMRSLEVSVYGGAVELPGAVVLTAEDGTSHDLTKRRLLFLKQIPGSRAFSLSSTPFLVELGNVVLANAPTALPEEFRRRPPSVAQFAGHIADAIKACGLRQ